MLVDLSGLYKSLRERFHHTFAGLPDPIERLQAARAARSPAEFARLVGEVEWAIIGEEWHAQAVKWAIELGLDRVDGSLPHAAADCTRTMPTSPMSPEYMPHHQRPDFNGAGREERAQLLRLRSRRCTTSVRCSQRSRRRSPALSRSWRSRTKPAQ